MLCSAFNSILFASNQNGDFQEPAIATVVLTGLVLVFAILIILTFLLYLEGKIFASFGKRKKEKEAMKVNLPVPVQATADIAPAIQEGIPSEVIAAIAAAVASLEGGKYVLHTVSRQKSGRSEWGLAGVLSYTDPF